MVRQGGKCFAVFAGGEESQRLLGAVGVAEDEGRRRRPRRRYLLEQAADPLFVLILGLTRWAWTYFLGNGRFTGGSQLAIVTALILFALALISEQVAALRFDRSEREYLDRLVVRAQRIGPQPTATGEPEGTSQPTGGEEQ